MRRRHRIIEQGQAALGMVLGIVLLLTMTAGILAATTIQHYPLVQNDVIEHLAYRALQSGVDSYLATIDANPNLVNCNSQNVGQVAACPTANLQALDHWVEVPNTSATVPEYYEWTNPQFCFNTACTMPVATSGANLLYLKEQVYGKAGFGSRLAYESTIAILKPENGFLTHLWWSNYEATDPNGGGSCTYDWNNNYDGPGSGCSEVFFGPNDVLIGPVYSNDSIYVSGGPNFGYTGSPSVPSTVTTHDPNCLFVDPLDGNHGSPPGCANATSDVGLYDTANSKDNAPFEPIPSTNSQLASIAAANGCLYSGPTMLTFYVQGGTPYMNVISPDTPRSGTVDEDNLSTNQNLCLGASGNGTAVLVPANGVVFVQNTPASQTCYSGANPFDDTGTFYGSGHNGSNSQLGFYDGQTSTPDCEGDAFVSNATTSSSLPAPLRLPSGAISGVAGNVTVASQNDIVVDGNLTYTTADCGPGFNSTYTGQCQYNSGTATSTNDSLGLVAYHFVEVNRPVTTAQSWWGGTYATGIQPPCSGTSPQVPLCDPGTPGAQPPTIGLTIDAGILALNDSFAVNNYSLGTTEGALDVYGAISQDYRGAVGTFSGSSLSTGYSKYYLWDSRLQYVTLPYYLSPGTPSWEQVSSAVVQGATCTTSLPGPMTTTNGTLTVGPPASGTCP